MRYRRRTMYTGHWRRTIKSGPMAYTGVPSAPTVIVISVPTGRRTTNPPISTTIVLSAAAFTEEDNLSVVATVGGDERASGERTEASANGDTIFGAGALPSAHALNR